MNILFISSLYPSQPAGSNEDITVALHQMTKYWNETDKVLVIRPVYYYLKELFFPPPQKNLKFMQRWQNLFHYRIFELDGVKIVVFPILKIPRMAYFYTPLYRFLDRYKQTHTFISDIVVAHYNKSLDIGYQYSQRQNLPLAVGIHAAPDVSAQDATAFTARCGKILAKASLIACRSNSIYQKITTWFPTYKAKSIVAFSGIEKEIIAGPPLGLEKLKDWKNNHKTISFITVSSLIEVKNIDANLHALAGLPQSINWRYSIIGDGPERFRLETLTYTLGLQDRVSFKGNLDHQQVLEELKKSHIFLLISRLESFGLVYLEAMATGNIVIGSLGEGIDGIIQNHLNGFLSPPGESDPLTMVLEKIIVHMPVEVLVTLLSQAYQTIQLYTDQKAAAHYLHHLKEMLQP